MRSNSDAAVSSSGEYVGEDEDSDGDDDASLEFRLGMKPEKRG